eukprot:gnl/TRDRNA2_/TRDRNA2_162875_c0_seq4.p1 gnl/TRDRNA2_/TRDRNA2_162875_c0~~gnl/TRDRNA2_/TRDRNA2_162875_c0_seq4.p1  ORF type:complete len:965 (+),score=124.08 gnl/TRDRNA2_/TRDRNA2_162875_c0_seq4:124-2895(+)
MLAIHSFLQEREIGHVGVVYENDAWSQGCLQSIRAACAGETYKCVVKAYLVPDSSHLPKKLGEITADGIRTVVNALITDPYALMAEAEARKMTGSAKASTGYIWIFPDWAVWDEVGGPSMSAYEGSFAAVVPFAGVRKEKHGIFSEHWEENVPLLDVSELSGCGAYLTMEQTLSPAACIKLAAAAYDGVARVRLALESADTDKPRHPKLAIDESSGWLGSEVRKMLQNPGTRIDGLIEGPDLRSSADWDMPWAENNAKFGIMNYAGPGAEPHELYLVEDGAISPSTGLSNAKLPGRVGFRDDSGKLILGPCNGENDGRCGYFGQCQMKPTMSAQSKGWCSCDEGFVGRFCSLPGDLAVPPTVSCEGTGVDWQCVPVTIDVKVTSFGGLSKEGESFQANLQVTLNWVDKRFPWDTGVYEDSDAHQVIGDMWLPRLSFSGIKQKVLKQVLTVNRSQYEEELRTEHDVALSLMQEIQATEEFTADFRPFPFDFHSLEMQLGAAQPEARLELSPEYTVLVTKEVEDNWDSQWPQDTSNEPWAELRSAGSNSFRLKLSVRRSFDLAVFRLIAPSVVLVIVSWGGFWIKPGALMPRFASGFISFLALQGFKNLAVKLMPNDGQISGISWIDIYISAVGIIMGLSVIETICCQYFAEHFSQIVSRRMDFMARWYFPLTFVTVIILMSIPWNLDIMLILVHVALILFTVAFYGYAAYEIYFFPYLFMKRAVRHDLDPARAHRTHTLTEPELQLIYNRLDNLPEDFGDTTDADDQKKLSRSWSHETVKGSVHVHQLVAWIVKVIPKLPVKDVQEVVHQVFGDKDFAFPSFRAHFPPLVTKLTVLANHGQPQKVNEQPSSVAPLEDSPASASSLARSASMIERDAEGDDEDDEVETFQKRQDSLPLPPERSPSPQRKILLDPSPSDNGRGVLL